MDPEDEYAIAEMIATEEDDAEYEAMIDGWIDEIEQAA